MACRGITYLDPEDDLLSYLLGSGCEKISTIEEIFTPESNNSVDSII